MLLYNVIMLLYNVIMLLYNVIIYTNSVYKNLQKLWRIPQTKNAKNKH